MSVKTLCILEMYFHSSSETMPLDLTVSVEDIRTSEMTILSDRSISPGAVESYILESALYVDKITVKYNSGGSVEICEIEAYHPDGEST